MVPRRAYVRRNPGNENVEPEVPQVLVDPLAEQVTHANFLAIFQLLAQAITTQANREANVPVSLNVGTMVTRIHDFTRMNPSEFNESKIDEVYKIVGIMGLSMVEKAELDAYQLKVVSQVWFEQ
uniref:Polyprotein n=1 Tax=Solanum tuberosum TaxID=4113 RepID=M1DQC2_SOLTU